MAKYPQNFGAFRDALNAFDAPDDLRLAIDESYLLPPVPQAVKVFEVLSAEELSSLDVDARRLLAGAAHLVATGRFHGKEDEALSVLIDVAPTIPDEDEPEEGEPQPA